MSDAGEQGARTRELAGRLAEVERRIERACASAGRDRAEVQLVVVTKFFPAEDVRRLMSLGVTDIGENRDQEASAKAAELGEQGTPPRMHFIGQVQTNKAGSVVGYADMVQSVDRVKLARALAKAAADRGRVLDVLLQVDLRSAGEIEADPGRGGVAPADLAGLARAVDEPDSLRLRGLMSVAPLGEDPVEAFARLARVREEFRGDFPGAELLSAGMSGDLEAGVAAGATHVRVGSAILGPRPGPR